MRVSFEKLLLLGARIWRRRRTQRRRLPLPTLALLRMRRRKRNTFSSASRVRRRLKAILTTQEEIILEGLLTDAPRVTIGGVPYVGEYDEDIGSTLYFDRSRLQQVADGQDRALNELRERPADDEQALVAVSSKRLKFA